MKCIKQLLKVSIAGILAIFILNVIVVAYDYTGTPVGNATGATDLKWKTNQLVTNMAEGIAFFQMDEYGFNNAYPESSDDIDILLMGSSHMQANQVAPDENVGYLLNEMIPDWRTYNIGMNGHTIYFCLDNLEAALEEYDPNQYVIIETMTVDMDQSEMEKVISKTRTKAKAYTGGSYYLETYVPGANSILRQISIWKRQNANNSEENVNEIEENDNNILNEMLGQAALTVEDSGCKLIILYHPTYEIQRDGSVITKTNRNSVNDFKNTCEENGIIFVDMTDTFLEHYESEHILPHGFCNTAVGEGHLNASGHRWIAEELVDVITSEK